MKKFLLWLLLAGTAHAVVTINDFRKSVVLVSNAVNTASPVPLSQVAGVIASNSMVNIRAFGAVGNGVVDDTVAIQAAVNYAMTNHSSVYCPGPSVAYRTGQINITNSLTVYGDGKQFEGSGGTVFWPNSATANVFVVNSHTPSTLRDFSITANLFTPTAGAGITFLYSGATTTANIFSHVENVAFDGMFRGIDEVSASSTTIAFCDFWNIPINGYGLALDNTFNKDQGDRSVVHCTFSTIGQTNCVCIGWQGGGGDRFSDNKFFNSPGMVINLGFISSNATAQLYITGNSFDGVAGLAPAINIFNNTSGSNFFGITISGANQFIAGGAFNGWIFVTGNPSGTVQNVNISGGNQFFCYGASLSGNGVQFLNCTNVTFEGNTVIGGGNGTGILYSASGVGINSGNTITNFFANIVTNTSPTFVLGPNSR